MRNPQPSRIPGEILSSSGFAEAIRERLNEASPPMAAFRKPERIAEDAVKRIIADAIRERLLLAIKLGQTPDFTGETLVKNFADQIDDIWRGLIKSPDKVASDFRATFKDWVGREPVNIIAIEGGYKRIEDAMMVCRVIKWVAGPGRLLTAFKEGIKKEDSVIKTCLDEFRDLAYPGFLHEVLAAGLSIKTYHAGVAKLYLRQGGELGRDVTLRFYYWRWWWPFEPMKKMVVTLDILDVRALNARIDHEFTTVTCGEALQLIDMVTKRLGSPKHLDFFALEKKHSKARKHSGGVTPNSNAPAPLKPLYAAA